MICPNQIKIFVFFRILFLVACLLAVLGLSLLSNTYGSVSVFGGGPIVFARWMGFGILTLFLIPVIFKSWYKYPLNLLFFILALASGSRGPILALFLTGIIYLQNILTFH